MSLSDDETDERFHSCRSRVDDEIGDHNFNSRKNVIGEIAEDRRKLFYHISAFYSEKNRRLPHLDDLFRPEEMKCVLMESVNGRNGPDPRLAKQVIDFAINTGYKDEPDVDENGNLSPRRTTELHHVAKLSGPQWTIMIRELFKIYNRFDVNYTNESGLTHFHIACQYGVNDAVEKFLELGQDPNCLVPETGDSPLRLALNSGHEKVMELLLRGGANPNLTNKDGSTLLHNICELLHGDYGAAEAFFKINDEINQSVDIDAQNNLGDTPLHLALMRSRKKVADLLLRRGANQNLANKDGLTPLHIICKRDFDDGMAKAFFEINDAKSQKVQVNAVDKLGRTPLQWAVANLLPDVVDLILQHGADLLGFVFPDESYFGEKLEPWGEERIPAESKENFKLRLASGALVVVERLEKRRYMLNRSNALTIMKFFAKHELFEKSADLKKCWYEDKEFVREAQKILISPILSLDDLIRLRPDEAAKQLTHTDYFEFISNSLNFPKRHREACALHLCEKLSKGFFLQWGLDSIMTLTCFTVRCCELIIEKLRNEDLYTICLTPLKTKA